MNLTAGTNICGFTVKRIRPIPGKNAELVEMVYEKTGTELAWTRCQDTNKLFSIAFKTLPEDSTGVFHILEHSVLCGSEKYPVREPFVELLKSSMNTFLNAMTFPDKTVYPVSSRNRQDFLNLTSVYLDAVFAPRILTDPNIFYQEGWHYEASEDGLTYNGVVFNEMKGAMSGMERVASQSMQQLLFPDNAYGHNSGGDPKAIPDLTYDQFRDAYRKNYHPSNARIYLDGDIPLEETLSLIESYLSRFTSGSRQELAAQEPKSAEATVYYEASPEEDLTSKAQLVLGKILGSWENKLQILATNVLCDVLAGNNDAPVCRAILNAGLGEDVSMGVDDGVYQPWVTLHIHNIKSEDSDAIRELLRATFRQLLETGLDKEDILAYINHLAYRTRDMQEPQGLIRCLNALDSWLYGGDPMLYLTYDEVFDALRQMAENGGFEKLLEELFLDETGMCTLHVLPSATLGEDTRAQEAKRLEAAKAAMSQAELEALRTQNEALRIWQQTPDSPEAIATLPVLDLKEISEEPSVMATEVEHFNGATILRHPGDTNGIIHLTAWFALKDMSLEDMSALSFLTSLMGQLPTGNYDAFSLQKAIRTHLGALYFHVDSMARYDVPETCTPCLVARCSVLKENLPKAQELLLEVLTSTDFRQPERIREMLLQADTDSKQRSIGQGHRTALTCAMSHYSSENALALATGGYSYTQWLHKAVKEFDAMQESLPALAQRAICDCAAISRLTLSVTEDSRTDLSGLLSQLPEGSSAAPAVTYASPLPKKLGIRIPAQVSFAGMAYNLRLCGECYDGTLRLLSNILSLSYLWGSIRVQGGAYGAGMQCGKSGRLGCYSFRDPSPARSLGVYRSLSQAAQDFTGSGEALSKFIISTVAETEPLLSPAQAASAADQRWISGITYEDLVAERRQLLNATPADLLRWCSALEAMAADAALCVVGHSEALKACEDEPLTVYEL